MNIAQLENRKYETDSYTSSQKSETGLLHVCVDERLWVGIPVHVAKTAHVVVHHWEGDGELGDRSKWAYGDIID